MIESLRCLPHDAVSAIWYLQLAGTPALMTLSGPRKQPEQTGVCTACYTDCGAIASGCLEGYAYACSSNRQPFTLHGTLKNKKQAKTLRGRKDTLALVYFYWGAIAPLAPSGSTPLPQELRVSDCRGYNSTGEQLISALQPLPCRYSHSFVKLVSCLDLLYMILSFVG